MTKVVPESHFVKGVSTLYGPDGEQKLQWVKSSVDSDRLKEFAVDLATGISQELTPLPPVQLIAQNSTSEELAVYPIGDAHIGLYCWHEEVQADWDLDIAEALMTEGFLKVLAATPDTEEALICNLGDWFHTDTPANVTAASGHSLDVDTRWAKVARVGIRLMRRMIEAALQKHQLVRVINSIGNHDEQTSQLLGLTMETAYENEPRVTIDTSPDGFHWHEFGNNFIGVHHGHKCKPEQLYKVMAEDKRIECGRCEHRYWYTGHIHHQKRVDVGGQVIESFRTLIPRDQYSHTNGFRSKRDICSITLHKEFGEHRRSTINIGQIVQSLEAKLSKK